ncbi:hypothetical protein OPQ81_005677 [Rhizoctonia solani]|nr:hypothetical protein OPQ81_005677 [Rhizoctonia solani]
MRTVISSTHPDPARQPRDPSGQTPTASQAPPLDESTLDPALNDEHISYPPESQTAVVPPNMQMVSSTSASPPPQYIATGPSSGQPPADGTEWGDVPRLPPILQVEKQHVTTTATQAATPLRGASIYEAIFDRTQKNAHLYRHYALHNAKPNQHLCEGCGKTFSRTDALNRHLRSDGGSGCRKSVAAKAEHADGHPPPPPGTLNGHYPISLAVNGPPPGAPADPNVHPHIHPHQLPPELNPQFLAGLLSGQQFLAAAAAAGDPNHQAPPPHGYEGVIQGVPAPAPAPAPAQAQAPESEPAPAAEDEGSERPSKRRAVSVGSEIVSVPVPGSGTETSEPPHEPAAAAASEENEPTT